MRIVWSSFWATVTRSDVGAVGARLYYEDDTIEHAGVVIRFGGTCRSLFCTAEARIHRILSPDHLWCRITVR